jgi:hypothetical protein
MPDGGLTDGDRAWMETRFRSLEEKIENRDSKINDMKIDVELLKGSSGHKCTEEIQKHEAGSWAHSPYKASGLIAAVVGIVEGAKKFFGH